MRGKNSEVRVFSVRVGGEFLYSYDVKINIELLQEYLYCFR